jgi:hypothetical protein
MGQGWEAGAGAMTAHPSVYQKAKRRGECEIWSVKKRRPCRGFAFDKNGRRYFAFANGCVKSQARLLSEILVGRSLEPDESVHHINGNRSDDRLANFQVVPTQAHLQFHAFVDNGKPAPPELARVFRFVREAA